MSTCKQSLALTFVAGLIGAFVASPVFSQGPGAMPAFHDFDLNKDGKVTEEEFNEARAARIADRAQKGYPMRGLANASSFAEIDTNHDGTLSPAEFAAHQASHRPQTGQ